MFALIIILWFPTEICFHIINQRDRGHNLRTLLWQCLEAGIFNSMKKRNDFFRNRESWRLIYFLCYVAVSYLHFPHVCLLFSIDKALWRNYQTSRLSDTMLWFLNVNKTSNDPKSFLVNFRTKNNLSVFSVKLGFTTQKPEFFLRKYDTFVLYLFLYSVVLLWWHMSRALQHNPALFCTLSLLAFSGYTMPDGLFRRNVCVCNNATSRFLLWLSC